MQQGWTRGAMATIAVSRLSNPADAKTCNRNGGYDKPVAHLSRAPIIPGAEREPEEDHGEDRSKEKTF